MDTLQPAERSRRMAAIRSKDTKPELKVRRLVHGMGYRYRLHPKGIPGRPDLAFGSRRKLIFVHGCFWHRHQGCALARMPKSRIDFWGPKLEANRQRDERTLAQLRANGWDVLIVWECEVKRERELMERVADFLGPTGC